MNKFHDILHNVQLHGTRYNKKCILNMLTHHTYYTGLFPSCVLEHNKNIFTIDLGTNSRWRMVLNVYTTDNPEHITVFIDSNNIYDLFNYFIMVTCKIGLDVFKSVILYPSRCEFGVTLCDWSVRPGDCIPSPRLTLSGMYALTHATKDINPN